MGFYLNTNKQIPSFLELKVFEAIFSKLSVTFLPNVDSSRIDSNILGPTELLLWASATLGWGTSKRVNLWHIHLCRRKRYFWFQVVRKWCRVAHHLDRANKPSPYATYRLRVARNPKKKRFYDDVHQKI